MWWLRQKIHGEIRVAVASTGFLVGVAIAPLFTVAAWVGAVGVVALACLLLCGRRWVILIILTASLITGVGYGSSWVLARDQIKVFVGSKIILSGVVKEDPGISGSGQRTLQLSNIEVGNETYAGTALVTLSNIYDSKRGDLVTVEGELKDGFGSFNVSMSQANIQKIDKFEFGDVGRLVRDWFAEKVRNLVDEPQASLGIGFLTGQKTALPADLSEALRIAGLTHIVVASGYNLTVLVRLARKLFSRYSKYLSTAVSSVLIVGFVMVTGLSPSMMRAGIVSGISVFSWHYGRSSHPFVLLSLVAAVTVAIQPSFVWGDVGWQLSFSAFFGVMVVAPLLQRYFFGNKEPGVVRQILGETIAAHIVTVPIIALTFGTVSNVAIIANLLVVPLVPLAMLMTFICGLWGIFSLPLSFLISEPTSWLLGYMVKVANTVSGLEWAQATLSFSAWWWVVYVIILLAACVWMAKVTGYRFRGVESIL